uniref:BT_2262 family domain-containing protein n=1 Tax=uncultured Draconibacterium sp. TaxID=1573823 RepID=UPI0032179E9E
MTSCDPSVEAPGFDGTSEVTFLPLITLEGGDVMLDCGATSYTDPGAVASAGGNEIELITNVSGAYYGGSSVDGPDIYSVSYSAYNDDGIPATAFRTVEWPPCNGDFVTSIAGVYTCSMTRTPGYSTTDIGPIFIKDLGDGVYGISDAIGGWYEHEYGYGPDYAATGMTITANNIATNDFTYDDVIGVGAFGGALSMTVFSVDPATKTISFTVDWDAGYVWKITLTQQ